MRVLKNRKKIKVMKEEVHHA